MWPAVSKMTPEPWPLAWLLVTEIETTLGETALAVTAQFGASALACSTGDVEVVALAEVPAVEDWARALRVSP
jgi:hypothetical protein